MLGGKDGMNELCVPITTDPLIMSPHIRAGRDIKLEMRHRQVMLKGNQAVIQFATMLLNPLSTLLVNVASQATVLELVVILLTLSIRGRTVHVGDQHAISKEAMCLLPVQSNVDDGINTLCICTVDPTLTERDVSGMLWDHAFRCMHLLSSGGDLVFGIHESYQRTTQILLWVLSQNFTTISLHKPSMVSRISTCKYVVCSGLLPRRRYTDAIVGLDPMLLADDCPLTWFSYMTSIQNKFTETSECQIAQMLMLYDRLIAFDLSELERDVMVDTYVKGSPSVQLSLRAFLARLRPRVIDVLH
jgi:hypothetical protein